MRARLRPSFCFRSSPPARRRRLDGRKLGIRIHIRLNRRRRSLSGCVAGLIDCALRCCWVVGVWDYGLPPATIFWEQCAGRIWFELNLHPRSGSWNGQGTQGSGSLLCWCTCFFGTTATSAMAFSLVMLKFVFSQLFGWCRRRQSVAVPTVLIGHSNQCPD